MPTSSPLASRSASKPATDDAPAATAVAHLLIHTRDEPAALEQLLTRYQTWWPARDAEGGVHVRVADLQGQQVLELQPVHSPMDVVLAPGTYHVNAHIGSLQRSFTVTLQQDMRFELFLHRATACARH